MKYIDIINAVIKNKNAEICFHEHDALLEVLGIDQNALTRKSLKEYYSCIKCYSLIGTSSYVLCFSFSAPVFQPVAIQEPFKHLKFINTSLYYSVQSHILNIINRDVDKACLPLSTLNKNVCLYQKSNINNYYNLTFFKDKVKNLYYNKGKKYLLIKNIFCLHSSGPNTTYSIILEDGTQKIALDSDIYIKYNVGD